MLVGAIRYVAGAGRLGCEVAGIAIPIITLAFAIGLLCAILDPVGAGHHLLVAIAGIIVPIVAV